ncbi:hypothetical protein [Hymenobacter sp. DG01]|uniref:hypothetical protein n=1 Tax=Hymenobacter sp. DG01 TaxID=2584940 RepID=UPI001C5D738C|nr:hypothetical protein [Hymenobacter sp. DG01]
MTQALHRITLALLIGGSVASRAAAQATAERNFLAGLVVTQQGDTLRGALQLFPQLHTVSVRRAGQPTHTLPAKQIRLVVAENEVTRSAQIRQQPMLIDNRPSDLRKEVLSAQQGGVWQYGAPQQAGQTVHVGRRHFISRVVVTTGASGAGPQYELFEVLESGAFILLQQQSEKNRVVKRYSQPFGVKTEVETRWIPEWHSTYFLIAPDGAFRQLKKPVSEIVACEPRYRNQMVAAARKMDNVHASGMKQLVQTLNTLVEARATAP